MEEIFAKEAFANVVAAFANVEAEEAFANVEAVEAFEANVVEPNAFEATNTNSKITLKNETDSTTLTFFTNPLYLNKISKKMVSKSEEYDKEVKFYRKRLVSLFKEITKGENDATQELKEACDVFIIKAIHYFQRIDKKDIIQGQHLLEELTKEEPIKEELSAEDLLLNDINFDDNITLAEANDLMMKKMVHVASLDNYVIAKHDISSNEIRFIPMKMDIDLKNPEFKTKGVKPRLRKSKIKKEDLSK